MIHFAELINTLSNARNEDSKVRALYRYFNNNNYSASFDEAAKVLAGQYPASVITTRQLKSWAPSLFPDYPEWLIDKSVEESGNIVNALSLLFRKNESTIEEPSLPGTLEKLRNLHRADEGSIKLFLIKELAIYEQYGRAVILRMMTGTFKSPVNTTELLRGLARVFEIPVAVVALRWYDLQKNKVFEIHKLGEPLESEEELLPLEITPPEIVENPQASLSDWNNFQAFGVRTGVFCQLVKHGPAVHLWIAGNNIITDLFTEIVHSVRAQHNNLVLIGQLTPRTSKTPLSTLEGILAGKGDTERQSFVFMIRKAFFRQSGFLKEIAIDHAIRNGISEFLIPEPTLNCSSWEELKELHWHCRDVGFDGILLRNKAQPELTYLWMATSRRIKAVLMYVEIDRMSSMGAKTMTFGMYRNGGLVPVAKVSAESCGGYSEEIMSFVKSNTIQRFGPVRTVNPTQVYELNYEGVEYSVRKKAGLTLLNPSISAKAGDDPELADRVEVLTLKD